MNSGFQQYDTPDSKLSQFSLKAGTFIQKKEDLPADTIKKCLTQDFSDFDIHKMTKIRTNQTESIFMSFDFENKEE
jgi:hypothetical protein